MNVSAVGFLFQTGTKNKKAKSQNYTCVIHKMNQEGNYNRSIITSPSTSESTLEAVSPNEAKLDFLKALNIISDKKNPAKFIGATIKDGVRETEIHSMLLNKVYAVRTKDEFGKNHFKLMGKNKTKNLLANNLYLNA